MVNQDPPSRSPLSPFLSLCAPPDPQPAASTQGTSHPSSPISQHCCGPWARSDISCCPAMQLLKLSGLGATLPHVPATSISASHLTINL